MDKAERRIGAGKDKNLPLTFSHDVWLLCDNVIGKLENVKYPAAVSGDTGCAQASVGAKTAKRYSGRGDFQEFMQVESDGVYNYMLPRCRAEQGMIWEDIEETRRGLGEEYSPFYPPDAEERDEEHRREGLRTGQRKRGGGEAGYERLVEALQDSTARNLEQSAKQLSFEQERHGDAMQLARDSLLLQSQHLDSKDKNEQKKIEQEERRLALESAAMSTFSEELQALASKSSM